MWNWTHKEHYKSDLLLIKYLHSTCPSCVILPHVSFNTRSSEPNIYIHMLKQLLVRREVTVSFRFDGIIQIMIVSYYHNANENYPFRNRTMTSVQGELPLTLTRITTFMFSPQIYFKQGQFSHNFLRKCFPFLLNNYLIVVCNTVALKIE